MFTDKENREIKADIGSQLKNTGKHLKTVADTLEHTASQSLDLPPAPSTLDEAETVNGVQTKKSTNPSVAIRRVVDSLDDAFHAEVDAEVTRRLATGEKADRSGLIRTSEDPLRFAWSVSEKPKTTGDSTPDKVDSE